MKTFPVDSIVTGLDEQGLPIFDRPYTAKELRDVYKTFFKDGVFTKESDELQVYPSSGGMTVQVHPGHCLIQGAFGEEQTTRTLQVPNADDRYDRVDTVVARFDNTTQERKIDLYIRKGVPIPNPGAPVLTRNALVWEIGLANLYIPRGITNISQARISDTRPNQERCGFVSPFVQLNTKTFYDDMQRQTDIAVQVSKDALDGTTAGHLQNEIDAVNDKFPVSIANGGTGATNAASAWDALRQRPKLMWEGNAGGGSDIVLNTIFGDYSLFAAEVSDYSDVLVAVRLPLGKFNFVGGVAFGADESNVEGALTLARLSYRGGDTFHIDGVQRINVKTGYIYGNPKITKIWAIV